CSAGVLMLCLAWLSPDSTAQPVLQQFHLGTYSSSGPYSSLVQKPDGVLWGTLQSDALVTSGEVFWFTPGSGKILVGGGSGTQPSGSLLVAQDGNLYGATLSGGTSGSGTLFRVTTNQFNPVQTIHSFTNGTDGSSPVYNLVQTSDGSLYGLTAGAAFFRATT